MQKLLLILGLIVLNACTSLPPKQQGTLRVLSYNIRHGADASWKMRLEDQAQFLASRKADLIALQEVDKNCKRSGSVDQPQFFGEELNMQPVFQAFMPFNGGQYGIAALSKLPVLEVTQSYSTETAETEPRKLPLVKVLLAEQPAIFVSVHFDWHENNTVRKKQVRQLLADLDKMKLPVILAGDFNDLPNSEVMQIFRDQGFTFKTGKKATFHGSQNEKTKAIEIDFIAVRGTENLQLKLLKTQTINQRDLSDHAPVEAEILWQEL